MPSKELNVKTAEHGSALDAIEMVVKILEAARSKTNRALGLLNFRGGDTTRLDRLQARISQLITRFNRVLFQLEAAKKVVRPPTPTEIAEARLALQKVREVTIKDAIRDAGFNFLSGVVDRANQVVADIEHEPA